MPRSRALPLHAFAFLAAALPAQVAHQFEGGAASSALGTSVGGGGDVNGDELDDVILGAPGHNGGVGRIEVRSGADGSTLFTIDGTASGDAFGTSVAIVGDTDGDGRDDFAVGAPGADDNGSDAGRVTVYSGADGSVLFTIDGAQSGDALGSAVSGAGDSDVDGFDDVAIGAALADTVNGVDSGQALIISGRDGTTLFTLIGESAGDEFGTSVAGAGDCNGDLAADVAVGAPRSSVGGTGSGRAYVISGADGSILHSFDGASAGDALGFAIAGVGDVNGDTVGDILVGMPNAGYNGVESGRVQVYSGADASVVTSIDGASAGARLGFAVSSAGDFDRDGTADFAVGSPVASIAGALAGRVQVYSGAGSVLYTIDGSAGDTLGAAIADAGQVTGDGYPEVIVGAPGRSVGGAAAGGATVFGRAPFDGFDTVQLDGDGNGDEFGYYGTCLGDIDNDDVPDFGFGAPQGSPGDAGSGYVRLFSGADKSVIRSQQSFLLASQFGFRIEGLGGDVNNDGIDDYIIGEPHASAIVSLAGQATVFSGFNAAPLYQWFGTITSAHCGGAVSGAGDVDNDGVVDIIVGAEANNITRSGSFWVYSGADGSELYSFDGDDEDDFMGWAVDEAGDLNGDGFDDFIVSATENRAVGINGPGYVRAYSGFDGSTLYTFFGDNLLDVFGRSIAGAHDVNADGVPDIIVGAPAADLGGIDRGQVTVYSGADGSELYSIDGTIDEELLGWSVAFVPDVNGDGYADFAAGAPGTAVNGNPRAGRAYIYSGQDGSVLASFDGAATDDLLGRSVTGMDDFNGDGLGEFLVGAPSDGLQAIAPGYAIVGDSRVATDPGLFTTYGNGCMGSDDRLPRIDGNGEPRIGETPTIELETALPSTASFLGLGVTQTNLSLATINMPGCVLLNELTLLLPNTTDVSGRSSFALPLANDPTFVGLTLRFQWLILDAAANLGGLVTSNGLSLKIGK